MKTKSFISFLLIAAVLLVALPAGVTALAPAPSDWAVPEMNDANTTGLLTPGAAKNFRTPLTRDEFCELVVEMVERTLGRPLPIPQVNPFVDDAHPINIYVLKAYNYGIVNGTNSTTFSPQTYVQRQQLCAMMIRAIRGMESSLGRTLLNQGASSLPYKDAARIDEYAIDPIRLAYSNEIMYGDGENFHPRNNISSQECVAVIIRTFNRIEGLRSSGMTNAQLLDAAVNRIRIGYAYGDTANGVTRDVLLPVKSTGGATVTWTSSNSNVIRISGSTGLFIAGAEPRSVTLTATVRLGNSTRTIDFVLSTSSRTGDLLLLDNAISQLDIIYINEGDNAGAVTGKIGLPSTVLGLPVTWRSNNTSVVSNTGVVYLPSSSDLRYATLTATVVSGAQSKTKTFELTIVNPAYSKEVTLHGVQLGMSQAQVTQVLGTVRRTISASNTESWQLYYSNSYATFVAVAFVNNRATAVYSMASNVANQLKNRAGTVITVSQANAMSGVTAFSYTDPGSNSQQYAIMICDSSSVIGSHRALLADGEEQLLLELVNAFRIRQGRTSLEWSKKLGDPARAHSVANGSGDLQQRVTNNGFDTTRYAGGSVVAGGIDAIDALNQIVSNYSGTAAMRTAILQNNLTLFGAGYSGGNSGSYSTYFTFTLGAVVSITGVTVRQNDVAVTTASVAANATSVVILTMAPTSFNESFTVSSSNTAIMTVTNVTASSTGATVTIKGVANGSVNLVVTGNSSGKSYNLPVSVGAVYANNLTLTCSVTGTAITLSSSVNVAANTSPALVAGSRDLVMGTNDTLTIAAATTNGAVVEWSRPAGTAATVAKSSTNNDGVVTATANAGDITVRARVLTGTNTYITHDIKVKVVTAPAMTGVPQKMNINDTMTATVALTNLPTSGTGFTPVYSWTSEGNQLSKTSSTADTLSAVFIGANAGTTKITFTATWTGASGNSFLGRISKTANVTVEGHRYADNIVVSQNPTIDMIPGQTLQITASTVPSSITQTPYSFTWVSDDTPVATVSAGGGKGETGTITAVSLGSATITVTLKQGDGPEKSVIVVVNVAWPVVSIIGSQRIPYGDTYEFFCNVNLSSLYTVKWTVTQGAEYADIPFESRGLVVPKDPGFVTIIANLYYLDGKAIIDTGISATYTFEVYIP